MITGDLVRLHLDGSEGRCATITRARGEKWLAEYDSAGHRGWSLLVVPSCQCCGAEARTWVKSMGWARCAKHDSRNPCAIEGCRRTCAGKHYSNDLYLCGEHWKIGCPPGSPERRVYNRLFRLAKKRRSPQHPEGWTADLEVRYWRVWARIVAIARARTAGDIDMDEINRLFGWSDSPD